MRIKIDEWITVESLSLITGWLEVLKHTRALE